MGFPHSSIGKESACNAEDSGSLNHKTEWSHDPGYNMGDLFLLGERIQPQDNTYCRIPFRWNVQDRHICTDRGSLRIRKRGELIGTEERQRK